MALSTHVTDRLGTNTPFLRGLTNHDDEDATTVNATRLGKACDAAEAQFPVHAGVVYDDTDPAHIEAGVRGAIAYLRTWSSKQGAASEEMAAFREELKAISKVSSRKRVTPVYSDADDPDIDLGFGIEPEPPAYPAETP